MRRVLTVLVSSLLVLMLLLPAVAGAAPVAGTSDLSSSDGLVLLATEGEGEVPGNAPPGPDSTENPNPPEPYQAPFLQNAAKGLVTVLFLTLAGLGAVYYLFVHRPRAAARQ